MPAISSAIGYFLFSGTSSSRRASLVACRLIASMAWVVLPSFSSIGTTPEVETVIRRREMPMPSLSLMISMASATWPRLYSGSPMPMNTMFERTRSSLSDGHSARSSLATCTWATISAAVRLRTSGWVPVWQKLQFSVQPTWLETHRAPARPTPGM